MRYLSSQRWLVVVVVVVVTCIALGCIAMLVRSRHSRPVSTNKNKRTVFVTDPGVLRAKCEAYFRGFNRCDAAARRCGGGKSACIDVYLSSMVSAAPDHQERFERAVASADAALARLGYAAPDVPWRLALLDERAESGFPHTHGDVVCMPATSSAWEDHTLIRTLAHERIHVLQREHPEMFFDAIAASSSGRVAISSLSPNSDVVVRRRSNPDLDGYLYVDSSTGLAYAMLFGGEKEAGRGGLGSARIAWVDLRGDEVISDTDRDPPEYEHPYERLAYQIAAAGVP